MSASPPPGRRKNGQRCIGGDSSDSDNEDCNAKPRIIKGINTHPQSHEAHLYQEPVAPPSILASMATISTNTSTTTNSHNHNARIISPASNKNKVSASASNKTTISASASNKTRISDSKICETPIKTTGKHSGRKRKYALMDLQQSAPGRGRKGRDAAKNKRRKIAKPMSEQQKSIAKMKKALTKKAKNAAPKEESKSRDEKQMDNMLLKHAGQGLRIVKNIYTNATEMVCTVCDCPVNHKNNTGQHLRTQKHKSQHAEKWVFNACRTRFIVQHIALARGLCRQWRPLCRQRRQFLSVSSLIGFVSLG